jgi:hypothetical protein
VTDHPVPLPPDDDPDALVCCGGLGEHAAWCRPVVPVEAEADGWAVDVPAGDA